MSTAVAEFGYIAHFSGQSAVCPSTWADERDRLLLIRAGHYHCRHGDRQSLAGPETVVFTPGGCEVLEWNAASPRFHCLVLVFRWPGRIWDGPLVLRDPHGFLRLAAHRLLRLQNEQHSQMDLARDYILQGLIGELVALSVSPEDVLVQRIRNYITDHLSETIRLDDLAAVADLSRYHFARTYAKLAGVSPMADVRRLRMTAAYNMIMHTDQPLKAVAAATGMANAPHLSTAFRETYGIGISELRRLHRIGKVPRLPTRR